MHAVRSLVALGVALSLTGFGSATPTTKLKAKHHEGIHGKVVKVNHDTSNTGSFEIRVVHHHTAPKKSAAAAAMKKHPEKIETFHVLATTHFQHVVIEANGKKIHHSARFDELKDGEHVIVHRSGKGTHDAEKVTIVTHRKKALKKTKN